MKRNKGPIVTHYPPPPPPGVPHISPPPTAYSPRPGYEGFNHGSPPGPPGPSFHRPPHPGHYDQYPPPNARQSASQSLPYSDSRDVYEHHSQGTPRVLPPDIPYKSPHYDQYDQRRLGPSPSASYGRPYSAPDRYDEHSAGLPEGVPYVATYRPPHQAHFEQYPPAPGVDNPYPGPPQSYPPPPFDAYRNPSYYSYDATPPARLYPPSHGSTASHYSYQSQYAPIDPPPYHARYDDRPTDRHLYESERRDTYLQHTERRSGDNWNRERHGRRTRYDSPKGRSRSERRFSDRPARLPSPIHSTPPAQPGKDAAASEGRMSQKDLDDTANTSSKSPEKYTAEDFVWEEEMIFKELPVKVTRDLIRDPLPAEWTDDPIMPPKYDKETITSKYINPGNVDDFALSVRETKAWQVVQYHPAFLPPTDVRIEKLWDYERALNPGPIHTNKNRHGINSAASSSRQRGKAWGPRASGGRQNRYSQHHRDNHLSGDDQPNLPQSGSAKRRWGYRDAEDSEGEGDTIGKKPKISSPEPGEVCETDDQERTPATQSTGSSWEPEYRHAHQEHNNNVNALKDAKIAPPNIAPASHSRQLSLQAPLASPAPFDHLSGPPSRPSSRHSFQGGPERPSSRHSRKSNASPLSSRRSSISSPLTPTERELLGMQPYPSSSDAGRESPVPQLNGASTRPRQRPIKLHAAYQ
ncbi:hypothetical protein NUW58_g5241 [Xylaria curta]|uniref:Uncharacterized protein n=1 Tax=Xylaria curta TaxID=42375 RepID=A0ACC1P5J4_9PEZI|nr:hypothetical protein NUW58_g5241 [Xylaria curta]